MIARTWRGSTRNEDAAAYATYIARTGLAAYRSTPGNRGAWLLHRADGDRTEFLALSLWESLDAVRSFAGDDVERAVFYPEDDAFLVSRETTADHWQVTEADGDVAG